MSHVHTLALNRRDQHREHVSSEGSLRCDVSLYVLLTWRPERAKTAKLFSSEEFESSWNGTTRTRGTARHNWPVGSLRASAVITAKKCGFCGNKTAQECFKLRLRNLGLKTAAKPIEDEVPPASS